MGDQWIVIPKWDEFQHYKDRDPKWIKNHRDQLAKDEYRGMSFHLRGILHGLRLSYAASNRQLLDSTVALSRRLGQRVTRRDLDSLNHAGFIEFSASKPLAAVYHSASLELELDKEKKRLSAHAPVEKPGPRSNAVSVGGMFALRTRIANGAISDEVDLEAELRSGEHRLNDLERQELVSELKKRKAAA